MVQNNFNEGISQFLQGIQSSNEQVAQLAAVYLKKKYIDNTDVVVKLTPEQS